jgi:carotenoid cleavage dioxygenase-like enzyme
MQYHWLGKDQFCSGAAFVPRVGGSHEDDGWIISFIHNEKNNTSQASFYCLYTHINLPVIEVTQEISIGIFMFLRRRCILLMLNDLKMLLLQK